MGPGLTQPHPNLASLEACNPFAALGVDPTLPPTDRDAALSLVKDPNPYPSHPTSLGPPRISYLASLGLFMYIFYPIFKKIPNIFTNLANSKQTITIHQKSSIKKIFNSMYIFKIYSYFFISPNISYIFNAK